MIAKVDSACLMGLEGFRVQVEVSIAKGLPCLSIVGLPDAAVREAKDRVVAAIRNTGFEFPGKRVTVNLAPAELRKEGAAFDLAIAMAILLATGAIHPPRWPKAVWLGELALDGAIRPVRGALALVRSLTRQGVEQFILPEANAGEVACFPDVALYPFMNLGQIVEWLSNEETPAPRRPVIDWKPEPSVHEAPDMAEIKGQAVAKRALEIAATGHHNLIMTGCPGTGKSMLARALPMLLPEWSMDESIDATQVHSVAGVLRRSTLLTARPFRTPHHTVSPAALIGGGDVPMPGEISLAHRGVLFLDELPEFRRDVLEALRQPLEEGVVHLQRARGRAEYPCEMLLVAAMNPCPCGHRGHPVRECVCLPGRIQKYMNRSSGPLMDRIDLQVDLPALKSSELLTEPGAAESSAQVRERVLRARALQRKRFATRPAARALNGFMRPSDLARFGRLDEGGKQLLRSAVEKLGLSGRSFDRLRRVARTIADLDGKECIEPRHLAEALQYRVFDRPPLVS